MGIRASPAAASISHICVAHPLCTATLWRTVIRVKLPQIRCLGTTRRSSSKRICHLRCRFHRRVAATRPTTTAGSTSRPHSKQMAGTPHRRDAMNARPPRQPFQRLTTIKCNKGVSSHTRVALVEVSSNFSKTRITTEAGSQRTWQIQIWVGHL